jgi:SAM-dependent methyltransferase
MKKKWTGERIETFVIDQCVIEHLHRYGLANDFSKDKVVLDIASGEGYGSSIIANSAKQVYGVDIDLDTIILANNKYKKSNLKFIQGSTSKIPFGNHFFDLVVSFETLEHHDEHRQMLDEIKRVLKPNGILIISTPDRKEYSDKLNIKNKFHIKELYEDEFLDLLKISFDNLRLLKQKSSLFSLIVPQNMNNKVTFYEGNFENIKFVDISKTEFLYSIAIASQLSIPEINPSFFEDKYFLQHMYKSIHETYLQSNAYKIGKFILTPVHILKKLLKIVFNG